MRKLLQIRRPVIESRAYPVIETMPVIDGLGIVRAARTLAGMTQRDLATALGLNERAVRFWERKHDRRPTSAPNDARIEQALLAHGVILFAEPTPGARLAENR